MTYAERLKIIRWHHFWKRVWPRCKAEANAEYDEIWRFIDND